MFAITTPNREMTVQNFQIQIDDVLNYFAHYDELFFFCPKYTRSVIEMAVMITLRSVSDYNPLTCDEDLMSLLVKDIEMYQMRNPHPLLEDSDYLCNLEIVCGQIDEFVDHHVRNKLPINQQWRAFSPRWMGNSLVMELRVY